MIYIYDYNSNELIDSYRTIGAAVRGMGFKNYQPVYYNLDRMTKGLRTVTIHRKMQKAVYLSREKIKQNMDLSPISPGGDKINQKTALKS